MTDLEKFIELYKSFGIDLKIRQSEDGVEIILNRDENIHAKLDGYMGFYSVVHFDTGGKFISQGFWE